jgi:hypothetical protein
MPSLPVTRSNAWTYWSKGLIAATNLDMSAESTDSTKVLANLAIKRGHNAIRLWFGWAGRNSILESDITAIAQSSAGWDSTAMTSQAWGDTTVTYAAVAAHLTKILDTCKSLGIGVFLVTDYSQGGSGKLWDPASGYANNLKQFWLKTYARWITHPALIGIDILNEPSLPDDQLSFAQAQAQPNLWPQMAQSLVTAIRTFESDNGLGVPMPLIVEGVYSGGPRSLGVFDGPSFTAATGPFLNDPQKRVVFSFHHYDPGCFTHQGVNEWSYEEVGTVYPLPGVVQTSYWYNGTPNYELRTYSTVNDLQAGIQVAKDFATKFGVPIFVGEFSAVQPTLEQVYPTLSSPRATTYPGQRVSELQNTVPWQAPLLDRLTTVRSQADFDALSASDRKDAYGVFIATQRRWITRLEVGNDGYMTATIGHVNQPTDALGTGFRVSSSPKTLAQLKAAYPNEFVNQTATSGYNSWARVGSPMTQEFYSQPNARIVGPSNAAAASLLVSTPQPVTLVRHAYTIRFKAPVGAVAGTVIQGPDCVVPVGDGKPPVTITMPVALLWLETPRTAAQVDTARFTYVRDLICTWQANGFSWAWFADDTESSAGYVGWRVSKSISELLSTATGGRKLTSRT